MDTYKKLFAHAENIEPPHGLAHAVLVAIALKRERMARRRRAMFGVLSLSSLLGAIPALGLVMSDIASSGMFQYLTLLFSDKTALLQYGKEFAFSLAETIPTASAALFLTLCALFIWSLAQVFRYKANTKAHALFTF
jgi:hypothetical protein